jgi:glycosyltransferase involved in cell wall biosynthesis
MKYLTILEDLDYRGSQRVAQNYSLGMKALGHEVRVLTINALGNRIEYLAKEGIICSCIATQPGSLDEIYDWSPDIVHIHRSGIYDAKINQVIVDLKSRVNPIVIETSIFSRVDYKIQPNIIDIHLHLTKWCLWKWLQWSKCLPYKPLATILPNSVISSLFYRSSPQDILDCKNKLGIPQNNFVFGRIGANCEAKWHPTIISSFKDIAETHEDVSLLLVSPPPSIVNLVENLPIDIKNKVFVTSKIESDGELRLLYSSMDVMIHASRIGESFGIVLAESLLCETPVIVLSSPIKDNSQVEIIKHQQTGLVVNNTTSFVRAMQEIYDRQDKAREFGKNGRSDILANYDNEFVCTRLDLLCKLLLENRKVPDSMVTQLLNENNFITEVPNFMHVLNGFYGKVPFHEKLIAKLVHHPQIYRFYANTILAAKFN